MYAKEWAEELLALTGVAANGLVNGQQRTLLEQKLDHVRNHPEVYITFMPRGMGLTALTDNEQHVTQVRRRFMLLGQTLAGMQVYDVRRAVQLTRELGHNAPLTVWGYGETASHVALVALYEKGIQKINLTKYPKDDKAQPDYLNISRIVSPNDILRLARKNVRVNGTGDK